MQIAPARAASASPSPRNTEDFEHAKRSPSPMCTSDSGPHDHSAVAPASSVIVNVPVTSVLRALSPPPSPSQPPAATHDPSNSVMYALQPTVHAMKENSFHRAATRDLFARCLAHQHRANPEHAQSEVPLACVSDLQEHVAGGVQSGPCTTSLLRDDASLEHTVLYLEKTLQALTGGHRIEGDYNFYPETIKQLNDTMMLSDPDHRQYGQHAWFEPLGRLAYTARLSVDETLSLAQAYTQAMRGEALQPHERQAVLLNRYCLDLTYLLYWMDAEQSPPTKGTEAHVTSEHARQRQAEIVERLKEDEAALAGTLQGSILKES